MMSVLHHEQEHHSCYIGDDNGYSQSATGEIWLQQQPAVTGEIWLQQQPAVTSSGGGSCRGSTVEEAAMRQHSGGGSHGAKWQP